MPLWLQYLVIAVAVACSAWVVASRQMPGVMRSLRMACALPLMRSGRRPWVKWLGRRLAPQPAGLGGAGCGGCNGCATGTEAPRP